MKLLKKIIEEIKLEGEKAYPYECCGLILGGETIGEKIFVSNNTRLTDKESSKEDGQEGEHIAKSEVAKRRFEITAEDFLKAEIFATKNNLEVVGIYHSHPDHPAKPSEFDLKNALPFYSYAIVSVQNGKAKEITSWKLKADRSGFLQEEV